MKSKVKERVNERMRLVRDQLERLSDIRLENQEQLDRVKHVLADDLVSTINRLERRAKFTTESTTTVL